MPEIKWIPEEEKTVEMIECYKLDVGSEVFEVPGRTGVFTRLDGQNKDSQILALHLNSFYLIHITNDFRVKVVGIIENVTIFRSEC